MSKDQKNEIVENVINELDLSKCAKTIVGEANYITWNEIKRFQEIIL
jgi:hypothetical protein